MGGWGSGGYGGSRRSRRLTLHRTKLERWKKEDGASSSGTSQSLRVLISGRGDPWGLEVEVDLGRGRGRIGCKRVVLAGPGRAMGAG